MLRFSMLTKRTLIHQITKIMISRKIMMKVDMSMTGTALWGRNWSLQRGTSGLKAGEAASTLRYAGE